jgi:RNA polymerase sigma-54 factor
MAITPRLDIRQSQTLVLTPQLQQAIKMLQLSSAELVEYVAEEVDKNPLLDYDERSPNPTENEDANVPDKEPEERSSNSQPSNEEPTVKTTDDLLQEASILNNQNETPLDTEYSEFYDENSFSDNIGAIPTQNLGLNGSNMITGGAGNFDYMESSAEIKQTSVVSLKTHLEEQLVLLEAHPYEKIIIHYLVGLMDDAGYITEETDLIAQKVGSDIEDINRIFKIAQIKMAI